jgi:hypothetical protein
MHKNFNHRLHRRLRHPRHRPHHLGGRPVQRGEMVRYTKRKVCFHSFSYFKENNVKTMSSKFLER